MSARSLTGVWRSRQIQRNARGHIALLHDASWTYGDASVTEPRRFQRLLKLSENSVVQAHV